MAATNPIRYLDLVHYGPDRPTGGAALALLAASLHFNSHTNKKTFRGHVAEFDFPGLVLIVGGVVCLLLGFNESETKCTIVALLCGPRADVCHTLQGTPHKQLRC